MSYEEMWLHLKKTIKADYEFFSDLYDDSYKGIVSEAEIIIHRMDELEHMQGDDKE